MRKSIIAVLLLTAACATAKAPATVTGWVSDAHCTTAHVGGKNPGCVVKCAKGGAHIGHPEWTPQAIVLVEDATERVLIIENPERVAGMEAQHVTITGRVEGDRLRIEQVAAAK
ncbi:MAG TPA: hypothetical protein VEK79_20870 [Thermoanaerobaculia bacterium]|nr:hypothetical protein [Thermoanaerobaculia bacterium]